MRDKLEQEGIRLRNHSPGNHRTTCPQCSHERHKKREQCLSVTVDDDGEGATWFCHHCEWNGGVGPGRRRSERPRSRPQKKREDPPAPPREVEQVPLTDPLLNFFAKRSISKATLDHFGITQEEIYFPGLNRTELAIVFTYTEDGDAVNHKYRALAEKSFRQDPKAKRTLFNADGVREHWRNNPDDPKEVIVVEGEMDVLALFEAGFPNAVSLPDGASRSIKIGESDRRFKALENAEWILDADKVILAGDHDAAGDTMRLELLHRFGDTICWNVEWPRGVEGSLDVQCKDANETLIEFGPEGVAAALKNPTAQPIDGLGRVEDHIAAVLRLYDGDYERPVSTGFEELDQIYTVMPGTFHVVTGIPNHGKSNFMDQIAINLMNNHGWKFAVFSPEHAVQHHLRRLSEKVVGAPFDDGPTPRMERQTLIDALHLMDRHFHFIEAGERVPEIDWILHKVKAAKLRYGINGVIIDPYNEISARRDTGVREDEHIRDLISRCKSLCRAHGITMWMVAHPFKMVKGGDGKYPVPTLYDISGASHWNNMADVGLVVHRDFETDTTEVYTRKIREQGLYGEIGFRVFSYNRSTRRYSLLPGEGEGGRDGPGHWS